MKKRPFILAALFVFVITLQSCFEISEIIRIKKDGSGSFSMTIDLSEMKTLIEGMGSGENIEGGSPFENMEADFQETKALLEQVDGVSNIRFSSENEGYKVTSSFDFTSVSTLNKGMDIVYDSEDGVQNEYYIAGKKSFERTSNQGFIEQVKKEFSSGDMGAEGMDLTEIFSEVSFVNTVIFEGRKIKKIKSGSPVISEDHTSASNRYYIFKDDSDQTLAFKMSIK